MTPEEIDQQHIWHPYSAMHADLSAYRDLIGRPLPALPFRLDGRIREQGERVEVVQITGLIARRIVCQPKHTDHECPVTTVRRYFDAIFTICRRSQRIEKR